MRAEAAWSAPEGLSPAQFTFLANVPIDAVDQGQVYAAAAYADLWLRSKAPNEPLRMNGDTLECELGHPWFQDAAASWRSIR